MSVATPVVQSWDGLNRRIYLKQGVETFHWIDDIYAEYIHQRRVEESFRKWLPLLKADGNNPKGGGKFTPRYITLLGGTRVVPYDENILINVTGEAITDNADVDPDPFDTTTRTQPLKLYIEPPAAEIVRATEELAAIAHMAFNGGVTVDLLSSNSGTTGSIGNPQYPVNNFADAKVIADARGFKTLYVVGNATFDATADFSGFKIIGQNAMRSVFTITPEANISNCEIGAATVTGTLDGNALFRESVINGVTYVNGIIHQCAITSEPIVLGGISPLVLLDCYSYTVSSGTIIVDFNHNCVPLLARGLKGTIRIKNMTTACYAGFGFDSGGLIIDASCTAGTVNAGGIINKYADYSNGAVAVTVSSIVNVPQPEDVWSYTR